jgi:triosephosphate isomerase
MMRKPIIAGNWKMYKSVKEAVEFAIQFRPQVADVTDRGIVLCVPCPVLTEVSKVVFGSNIALGAQNLFWEDEGAFTGEISAPMLKEAGCSYVIIGHSERRQYFGETDETVNKKLLSAVKHGLNAIVCVGETLEERETGKTLNVVEKQIRNGLKSLEIGNWSLVIIAYEPIWAIGTGRTATPEQAQEVHVLIRSLLPKEVAGDVRILYGGSVKPENIKELMAQPDIDGGLVGGASLKVDSFVKIAKY